MKQCVDLVFIPAPGMGHLVSAVEMAKLLLHKHRPDDLSISVLIMRPPSDSKVSSYVDSLPADPSSRLRFVSLSAPAMNGQFNRSTLFRSLVESYKQSVRDWVSEFQGSNSGTSRIAGVVVDMFCVSMMDVADEFGIPSYVYYTSGAAVLGLLLQLQSLRDNCGVDVTGFKDSDPDLKVPTYSKDFPVKLMPGHLLDKAGGGSDMVLDTGKQIRAAKGIIVNTFFELEEHALGSLSNKEAGLPPLYPVGPVLNLQSDKIGESEKILEWLDIQQESSVVFLCFGSGGSFPEPQVKEIARALERSGHRFLWALRSPPPKGSYFPGDYSRPEEVLPEGFLERTESTGKVIGWAPQDAVLAHPAVGGFVSHCGWNSTLESIWFGVPMATWPIYAEQQANAFQIVTEIGTGVELKMDYRKSIMGDSDDQFPETVDAETIEAGIRKLMDDGPAAAAVRKKAEEMKEKSRKALEEGGSSFKFLQAFCDQVFNKLK